jgi:hypothetical protein
MARALSVADCLLGSGGLTAQVGGWRGLGVGALHSRGRSHGAPSPRGPGQHVDVEVDGGRERSALAVDATCAGERDVDCAAVEGSCMGSPVSPVGRA